MALAPDGGQSRRHQAMGVRHRHGGARACRGAAHHRLAGRPDARPDLHRAHVLRGRDGRSRQHDGNAGRRPSSSASPSRSCSRSTGPRGRLPSRLRCCSPCWPCARKACSGDRTQWQAARRGSTFWIAAALFVAAAAAATFLIKNEYPFFAGYVILQFIVLATAWNILGGYAGYVNFGTSAFFGLGVYTAVFLFKATGAPLVVQILPPRGSAPCSASWSASSRSGCAASSFPSPPLPSPSSSRP